MKTELEKKLNKLPDFIIIDNNKYDVNIYKGDGLWYIDYTNEFDNCYLFVVHQSLQAAVDTTLKEIKNL